MDRYRNLFDPVSVFDGSANNSIKWNPFDNTSATHTFQNLGEQFKSEGSENANGWVNPDGTTSLIQ